MATWEERKRLANIAKHGLDFEGCEAILDQHVWSSEDTRDAYGEQRLNLVGWLNGKLVRMTYTERHGDLHIISLRKAKKHEIKRYNATLSRNP